MGIKITPEDKLFSNYIRERDNWTCRRCGKKYDKYDSNARKGLHNSHFYSRGCWSTRFDEKNCFSHCKGCHDYFEGHPHEFSGWVMEQLGEEEYWRLVRRANTDLKTLYGLSKKQLRAIVKKNYTEKLKEVSHERFNF